MNAAAFDPETPASTGEEAPPSTTERSELLEQVLRETLAVSPADPASQQVWSQALSETVQRRNHAPQELSLEAAAELVRAALQARFPRLALTDKAESELVRRIAEKLMEDPLSHQRLSFIWSRLSGSPP